LTSALVDSPLLPPQHISHIPDRSEVSDVHDTYLACVLDQIADTRIPAGVVRTSTSAILRASFEESDEELLKAVAKHLSGILREEFTSQEQFIRQNIERQQVGLYLQHKLNHIAYAVRNVKTAVGNGKSDILSALNALEKRAEWIPRFHNIQLVLKDISNLRRKAVDTGTICTILEKVLGHHRADSFTVRVSAAPHNLQWENDLRQHLFALACVIEEIVTNCTKHSSVELAGVDIAIEMQAGPSVNVIERVARPKPGDRRVKPIWKPAAGPAAVAEALSPRLPGTSPRPIGLLPHSRLPPYTYTVSETRAPHFYERNWACGYSRCAGAR
jgi:hypothetical protein